MLKFKYITLNGVKVNIDHHHISEDLKMHFYNETYEGDELDILKQTLDQDDIVLEVEQVLDS